MWKSCSAHRSGIFLIMQPLGAVEGARAWRHGAVVPVWPYTGWGPGRSGRLSLNFRFLIYLVITFFTHFFLWIYRKNRSTYCSYFKGWIKHWTLHHGNQVCYRISTEMTAWIDEFIEVMHSQGEDLIHKGAKVGQGESYTFYLIKHRYALHRQVYSIIMVLKLHRESD